MEKKVYEVPTIDIIEINLEESIAESGLVKGSGLWEEIF